MSVRIVFLLLATIVAGCARPTGSASSEPSGSTADPAGSPAGAERLFGQVADIDLAGTSITIDLAQFFNMPDALVAAREDGAIGPNEDLPNPFYIRALRERRTLEVAEDASVTVLGRDAAAAISSMEISMTEFAVSWRRGPATGAWDGGGFYWFTVTDGRVLEIKAQYLP